ncbi:ABC transporter ATP-binding protein [Candidatus Dependentiae bacterium]|nr:ABC transporter ATP-binding protein [Candidatus Dependentiae bacterium]MCC7414993.1 ABC transporter ATP-binding protein [Campylobacterota bacterium]
MKRANALIKLLKYASPSKSKIVFASVCSVLNKLCDIVPEILIGISIDIIVNQQHSIVARLGIINPFYQLYLVGALTALLWILESVFEYLYSIAWRSLAQEIQHNLRLKTYATMQDLDLSYFENKTTGGLLNVLQEDIQQLEQFLSQGPNEIIQLTVNIIVMGLIFFYLSPVLAFLTLLPIPFIIGLAYYFQNKLAHLYESVRQSSSNLASHIAYRLQGITTIKSYTTEAYELTRLQQESDLYQEANHNASRVNALYIPIVRMAIMAGFIMSLIVGGIYALQGIIPINWYAALVFLTQRFLWPFTSLATITDMYERTIACAKRILGVLESTPTLYDGNNTFDITAVQGSLAFTDASFSYSNDVKVLNNVSFEIPAHTTVAFVGATGSGKSTIIKLLLRFYDPNNGLISVDGHNIKNLKLCDLRKTMALVSQDVYLVEGTVADNISYGTFDASRDEIVAAAKMAQAHEFIMELPLGYDTKIQEHGKNFSGGQRQRIAIARAIMKKSPILIFDEATSAIDNETEVAIQQSISKLSADHTIIIIAHRLSTVRNADTIFVLDKGSIVESGNHEMLLKQNGAYSKLWNATN